MVRKLGILAASAALLATAACGSDSGGTRPSADDVSKAMTSGKAGSAFSSLSSLGKPVVDCISKAIVDSKLSNGAVRAIVKGDTNYKEKKGDEAIITDLQTKFQDCAKAAAGSTN